MVCCEIDLAVVRKYSHQSFSLKQPNIQTDNQVASILCRYHLQERFDINLREKRKKNSGFWMLSETAEESSIDHGVYFQSYQ